MKLTVAKADSIIQVIEPMLKDAKGITAYILAKNLRILSTELIEYQNEKTRLFEKYGTKDGDRMVIDKKSDNYQKFLEEFKIFDKETIDVELRKIKEEELINSGLNGEQMYLLGEYFVE